MTEEQEKLIIDNMGLVYHMIKKYNYDEDCASIGMIGLIKGVKAFDKTKGYKLSTYLCKCIKNEILCSFRKDKKLIKPISLDECLITENISLIDCLEDEKTNIEDEILKKETSEKIMKAIMKLTPIDRDIVISLYGLYGKEKLTQVDLRDKYGYSQPHISRKHRNILKKLKRIMESDNIDLFT